MDVSLFVGIFIRGGYNIFPLMRMVWKRNNTSYVVHLRVWTVTFLNPENRFVCFVFFSFFLMRLWGGGGKCQRENRKGVRCRTGGRTICVSCLGALVLSLVFFLAALTVTINTRSLQKCIDYRNPKNKSYIHPARDDWWDPPSFFFKPVISIFVVVVRFHKGR